MPPKGKVTCAGCRVEIKNKDYLNCPLCKNVFDLLCANVPEKKFLLMSAEQKEKWSCQECLRSKPRNNDNNTPVRNLVAASSSKTQASDSSVPPTVGESYVTVRRQNKTTQGGHADGGTVQSEDKHLTVHDSGRAPECTRKHVDGSGSEIIQLTEQLRLLTSEFTSVKTKLDDLTQSLNFSNERMDDIMKKFLLVNQRLGQLEQRDVEVNTLQNTVAQLQNELEAQAQSQLRNEIEIIGIPETNGENLHHTLLVTANLVGVQLDDKEMDWVARAGPRRPPITTALPEDGAKLPRPVVVRFLRRSMRDQFLKAAKSRKNITSVDLGIIGASRQIYFNERLTKVNRKLFRDARARAKQLGYAFCWCSQGAIHVREREGKHAVLIRSHNDLDRLLPWQPPALSASPLQASTSNN